MKKIIVYAADYCPFCHRAIRLLESKGVSFEIVDIQEYPEAFKTIQNQTGWDTIPQIFIQGQFIGGSDDLHTLDIEGKLDEMIF